MNPTVDLIITDVIQTLIYCHSEQCETLNVQFSEIWQEYDPRNDNNR